MRADEAKAALDEKNKAEEELEKAKATIKECVGNAAGAFDQQTLEAMGGAEEKDAL
jgi:uncharacterized protein YjbJ (UPF0337 family)